MSIKKLFIINAILITFSLLIVIINDKVFEIPLKRDTEITKGYVFESELKILMSGKYSLLLTFDSSKTELQKVFGGFACWNRKKEFLVAHTKTTRFCGCLPPSKI